jgi:two-component sensor histidine kinase
MVAFVGAALLVRLLLQPLFGSSHVYIAFYLAVVLTAFVAGRWAGLGAIVLSGAAAFWMFQAPAHQFKAGAAAFAPLAFFALNAGVAVYLIAGLGEALTRVAKAQDRAEAAARRNADLFRELNEQVAQHLQLVAGVLALQADDETEASVADALAKASATSLMLARAHRDSAGREAEAVDFLAFAQSLVEAKLASHGLPPRTITLSGEALELPTHQATSLGAALLECLGALLGPRAPAQLSLEMRRRGGGVALRVSDLGAPSGAAIERLAEGYLLRAAVEQLGARVTVAEAEGGGTLEILFRPAAPPIADAEPVTLH